MPLAHVYPYVESRILCHGCLSPSTAGSSGVTQPCDCRLTSEESGLSNCTGYTGAPRPATWLSNGSFTLGRNGLPGAALGIRILTHFPRNKAGVCAG